MPNGAPILIEPTGNSKELHLQLENGGVDQLVVSGYAHFFPNVDPKNPNATRFQGWDENDNIPLYYEARILVGPDWQGIRDVSAIVTVSDFIHTSSDTANSTGFGVTAIDWKGVDAPNPSFERLQLRARVQVQGGEDSFVTGLAYHAVIKGVLAPGYVNQSGPQAYRPAS